MTISLLARILVFNTVLVQGQYGSYTGSGTLYHAYTATPRPDADGNFTWPAGPGANVFTEGSIMNVSWTTSFEAVNLWLTINNHYNQPVSLATNWPQQYYEWTIDCHGSCKYPFQFNIVDTNGNRNELNNGPRSKRFWITPSTQSSVATSTSSPPLPSTASTTSSTSTAATPLPSPSPSIASPSKTHSSSSNHSVSIGAGVGVGVGALLLGIAGFFVWRYHRKKTQENRSRAQSELTHSNTGWYSQSPVNVRDQSGLPLTDMGYTYPVEAYTKGATPRSELAATPYSHPPQELPGREG